MVPKFRNFPTFWTGLRSGVFDTRNAQWLRKSLDFDPLSPTQLNYAIVKGYVCKIIHVAWK